MPRGRPGSCLTTASGKILESRRRWARRSATRVYRAIPPLDHPGEPRGETPLFRPGANGFFRLALLLLVMFGAGGTYGVYAYYHSPWWTREGFAPDQPVLFSHRHHAGELRIDCRYCHATVDTAAFAGMPSTQTCLSCHSQIFTDTKMIRPLLVSLQQGEPLRWNRVTRLPGFVYFDHGIHVHRGVACASCHGDVAQLALETKRQPLDMRMCLDCHRHAEDRFHVTANHLEDCSTCHR